MNKITLNLYQGSRNDAIKASQDKSFDLIVYLGQNIESGVLMYKSRVPLVHFPLNDGINPESKIRYILDLICKSAIIDEDKVLVACRYGVSRSPSIVTLCLAGLVTEEFGEMTFDVARYTVSGKVQKFKPVPELINQLKQILSDGLWEKTT